MAVRKDPSPVALTLNATTPEPQPARRLSIRSKLGLLVGSTILSLVLAEIGMRVMLRMQGEPYDGAALMAELERNADTVKAFTPRNLTRPDSIPADRVRHPFFGSESGPDPGGVLAHFQETAPEAMFEVLVVGGSVSMLFARDAGEELRQALAKDPRLQGREVRVLHGGHAAYKQPQQLNKVAYFFAHGYRPDVVLNIDGFNEVANGFNNGMSGTHPLYPTPPVWAGLFWGRSAADIELAAGRARLKQLGQEYRGKLDSAKRFGLLQSAITGSLVRSQLRSIQKQRSNLQNALIEQDNPKTAGEKRTQGRELRGDSYDRDESAIMALSIRNWVECSISLSAICEARGVRYLHALQPTLWDPGAKPIADKEQDLSGAKAWRQGVETGYPLMRAAAPELEAAGVHFLDLSKSFAEVEEPIYFDPCHFAPEGSKMLVSDVAGAILKLVR